MGCFVGISIDIHSDEVLQSEMPAFKSLGSQVGEVFINRASHLYDPGSSPGLRTWADICQSQSHPEGFSSGTAVFLPLQIAFFFHAKI